MLISAGKYTLSLPDSGDRFTVLPNEISYIPPNTRFIRRVIEPIDFHQFNFRASQAHPIICSLSPGKLKIPQQQAASILQSLSLISLSSLYPQLILHELEHILNENHLFSSQSSKKMLSEDIRQALVYMEEHLSERIDMDDLAASVYLSRSGLIWKFRRELGTTPQQHLISLRMRLAKQLLLEDDLPIAQVADRCGYASAYYFSNAFRQTTGISPSVFRKSHLARKS